MRANGEGQKCPHCPFTWEKNSKPGSQSRRRHLKRCPGNAAHGAGNVEPSAAPPDAVVARSSDGVTNGLREYYYDQGPETAEAAATLGGQQGPPTDLDPEHEDHLGVQRHRVQGQLRLGQTVETLRLQGPPTDHRVRGQLRLGHTVEALRLQGPPTPPTDLDPEHEDHRGVQRRRGQPNLAGQLRLGHGVGAQYLLGGPPPPANLLRPLQVPIFLGDPLRLLRDLFHWPEPGVDLLPVVVHRPPVLYMEADRLQQALLQALLQPVALVAGWFGWFTWALSVALQSVAGSLTVENLFWAITAAVEIAITYLEMEIERVQESEELWDLVVVAWILLSVGVLAISMMLFLRHIDLDSPSPAAVLGIIEIVICMLNVAFVIAGRDIGSASERFVARVLIAATIRILWRVAVRMARGH